MMGAPIYSLSMDGIGDVHNMSSVLVIEGMDAAIEDGNTDALDDGILLIEFTARLMKTCWPCSCAIYPGRANCAMEG